MNPSRPRNMQENKRKNKGTSIDMSSGLQQNRLVQSKMAETLKRSRDIV